MKNVTKLAAAALAMALAGGSAHAHVANVATYDFTFTGTNYDVTGWFTTDAGNYITNAGGSVTAVGSYTTTSGAFGFTGYGSGSAGGQAWSNTYDPTIPGFSGNGLGIDIGGTYASIYNGVSANYPSCTGTCFSVDSAPGALYNPGDVGTLTVAAAPEISTWAMMLAGFAGLGFAGYRRTKSDRAALAA